MEYGRGMSGAPKSPSAIYRLIWQAMRQRQNIAFEYNGRPREGSPIILGYSDTGRETLKLYQTGGRTSQGRLPTGATSISTRSACSP